MSQQLPFPGFTPLKGGDRGMLDLIRTGTQDRPGAAPSMREIACALMVDEQGVRGHVDRLVENGMVVELRGVLLVTGRDPFLGAHWLSRLESRRRGQVEPAPVS
jgi:hypothetical protein